MSQNKYSGASEGVVYKGSQQPYDGNVWFWCAKQDFRDALCLRFGQTPERTVGKSSL